MARQAPSVAASDVVERLRSRFERLSPELQRAARWVGDHPNETGLWSMRHQARAAGVSAPTMVRLARNGIPFDGVGGTVHDQVDALGPEDVLIAISQDPYSTPTVEAVITAAQRGVTVVALTDSALSPLARNATHFLLFRADSISFFPSMIAPLALVELLVAWLAAKGGRAVLKRLGEVDARLAAQRAYWNRSPRNTLQRSSS